jgi:hypothetical protein
MGPKTRMKHARVRANINCEESKVDTAVRSSSRSGSRSTTRKCRGKSREIVVLWIVQGVRVSSLR